MFFAFVTSLATPVPTPIPTPTPEPNTTPTPTPTPLPHVSPTPTPSPTPVVISNREPVAIITCADTVKTGNPLHVKGSNSYDLDGTIVSYTWVTTGATGNISGAEGTIKYESAGTYAIHLTVVDDKGSTNTAVKTISVAPDTPVAYPQIRGTLKKNRKVVLDGINSWTPEGTVITSYEWRIETVSGGTPSDIKYAGGLHAPIKEVLFESAGAYNVTLKVVNSQGYSSENSILITIYDDEKPVADFFAARKILRDPYDYNYATIELTDCSYSLDGDIIARRKWTYKYDSDNDGSFDDEVTQVLHDGNSTTVTLRTNQVGKYLFELEVYEGFGQDTIPGLISGNDYAFDTTSDKPLSEKVVEVINVAPVTSFEMKPARMIDVYVFSSDLAGSHHETNSLSALNDFKAEMLSRGFDVNYIYYNTKNYTHIGNHNSCSTCSIAEPEVKFGYQVRMKIDEAYMTYRWGEITELWHNGKATYYLLDGGRLGATYRFEWYEWDGWYSTNKDILIPVNDVEDIVFTTNYDWDVFFGEKEKGEKITNVFIVRLTNGDFKKIRWTFDTYNSHLPAQYCMTIKTENLTQAEINILNEAYSEDNVIFCKDANSLIYGKPTEYGYCDLYEIVYSAEVMSVSKIPATSYYGAKYVTIDTSSSYPELAGYAGWIGKLKGSSGYYWETYVWSPKLLPQGRNRIARTETAYKPVKVYGLDYDVLRSNINVRTGAVNYAIFFHSIWDKKTGYGLVNTLNDSFVNWLNDNNFEIYISARDDQLTTYQSAYAPDHVQNPQPNRQTVNLSDLMISTNFCELVNYNNLQAILDDIKNKNPAESSQVTSYAIVGEPYNYEYFYKDYESDPLYEMKWKYTHDPYFFENSEGLDPDSGQLLSNPKQIFTKPGKYIVVVMSRDNPKNNNKFDSYRLWSDEKNSTRIIYAHRRPVANFEAYVYYDNGYRVKITDNSYDPDRVSSENRGIAEKRWQYRVGSAGAWINGLPSGVISSSEYTYIKFEVRDMQGAWSEPEIIAVRGEDYKDTPPDITVNPDMRPWDKTNVSVNVSCTGNFTYVDYLWSTSAIKPAGGWNRSYNRSFSLSQQTEGIWFLHIEGVYGNGKSYKLAGPYCIDKTLPTGTYTVSNSSWTNSSVLINVKGIDTLSGIKCIRLPNGTVINSDTCNYAVSLNGTYNFVIEDNAGNTCTVSVSVSNIDDIYPSGVFSPDNSSWTNDTVNVAFYPSDAGGSGIDKWRYRVSTDNGSGWGSWSSYITGGAGGNIPLNRDGIYKIQAEVVDRAGNIATITSGTYYIETVLPEGKFLPNAYEWTNDVLKIIFDPEDSGGSGLYRWRYRTSNNNGGNYGSWSDYFYGDTSGNIFLTQEGLWKIQAEVYDNAGNSQTITSGTYCIDMSKPSGGLYPGGCDWTNSNVTVLFNYTDSGGSGVSRWRYRTSRDNGHNFSDWSLFVPAEMNQSIVLDSTGVWRIQVEVYDKSGNMVTVSSNAYLIDKSPPLYTATDISGYRYRNGAYHWIRPDESVSISIRGYEAESGMRYSYIRLPSAGDNRAVHDWESGAMHINEWMTSSYTKITGARESLERDGYYEVTWSVKGLGDVLSEVQYGFADKAGNIADYNGTGCYIGVDGTSPGRPLINSSNGEWTNRDVIINITHGTDTGSGVEKSQYKIGYGSEWLDYTSTFTVSQEGETIIYARTVDNVGNIGEESFCMVKIDKTPPVIQVSPQSHSMAGFELPVEVNISDAGGSGFSRFRYAWSGTTMLPGTWNDEYSSSCSISYTETGTAYLHIEAFDKAGNKAYGCYGPYTLYAPRVDIFFNTINGDNPILPFVSAGGSYSIVSEEDSQRGAIIKSNIEVLKAQVWLNEELHGELVLGTPEYDGYEYIYGAEVFCGTIPPDLSDGMHTVKISAETVPGTTEYRMQNISVLTLADLNIEVYNDAEKKTYTDATNVETEQGIFNSILSQYFENVFIARTTPYVSHVNVELMNETGDVYQNISLSDNDNDNKWDWTTHIDEPFFEGVNHGTMRFTAITTNGNVESKEMTYYIRRLKLENFRITKILDFNWKEYFEKENGEPTELAKNGIGIEDMPVFRNIQHDGIKLGYMINCRIDSAGLDRNGDYININVSYYAMDNANNIFEADIYVQDKNGEYCLLRDSEYYDICHNIQLNRNQRTLHDAEPDKANYNTWFFDFFLPSTAKVVKKGEPLDLFRDNTLKNKLLVVFDITAHSETGATFDYTFHENKWAAGDGSSYGANRPSQLDLAGKGRNHGEVFWYNLSQTALDDLKFNREW
ncbi:MAG TPA: hypothetical protein GXX49_10880 [Clostridiaceae bacterium]|nr:hypothetical protein [Clostridiaceae bacterium]